LWNVPIARIRRGGACAQWRKARAARDTKIAHAKAMPRMIRATMKMPVPP
jgi:hypothetical protein